MPVIFHITTRDDWRHAQAAGYYGGDSLVSEGFIHCSQPHQVVDVANRLFRLRQDLVVLHIDTARLEGELRYENLEGGGELFPHIYDRLSLGAIVGVSEITPSPSGTFDHCRPSFESTV
jgi:uncharacterized protein (DUF952 family)